MKTEMPTRPSQPTTAISEHSPSAVVYSSETMALVGK
jgi:hypothetical protein